ncbi:hypothetical protein KSS87_002934 [Heliosperma pusillum]|nr:hypothetical protein KSS87_002934 [Heliosperma pusillum]
MVASGNTRDLTPYLVLQLRRILNAAMGRRFNHCRVGKRIILIAAGGGAPLSNLMLIPL